MKDEELERRLAEIGADDRPPAGWQQAVWRKIEERKQRRAHRRRPFASWLLWAPAGALAAAALAFFLLLPSVPPAPGSIALEASVIASGGPARRGEEARPGDRLRLEASVGDARYAELRLYRGERELILACSGEPPCVREGTSLRAEVELAAPGDYQGLLLTAEGPIPPAGAPGGSGDLDTDTAAALAAGAELALGPEVRVR